MMNVLDCRSDDRVEGLTYVKGSGKRYTVKKNIELVKSILAVRTLIHGRQNKNISMVKAVETAVEDLKGTNPYILNAVQMRKLLAMYYFAYDSEEEKQISKNMESIFHSLGDHVAGDEKLFYYIGASGFVRKVPSKPTKIGLWMYQAAVQLACGLPCLIYTKMHNSSQEAGIKVKCHDIVSDWGKLIAKKPQHAKSILFMDNYYLQQESRRWLRDKKLNYTASIQQKRFQLLVDNLKPKLTKSGTYVMAFNRLTQESLLYC